MSEDVLRSQWVETPDGGLEHHLFQPSTDSILGTAQRVRNDGGAQTTSWGRAELSIPYLDYMLLVKRNPLLNAPDREIQKRAWQRFANSSEARKYRLQNKGRSLARSIGGLFDGGQTGSKFQGDGG